MKRLNCFWRPRLFVLVDLVVDVVVEVVEEEVVVVEVEEDEALVEGNSLNLDRQLDSPLGTICKCSLSISVMNLH